MPKRPTIKVPPKRKKGEKQKFTSIGKPRTKKEEKTVKVLVPALIPGKGVYDPDPPPSEYEISYKDAMLAVEMESLAAKGLTNDQIIDILPISRDTFYKRLKEEPYFSYCLMKHRKKAIDDVTFSLYNNCVGFSFQEQQATASGKVVTVNKFKLPETKAIEFYLTNKDPENWKKKIETTIQAGESMGGMMFAIKRRED